MSDFREFAIDLSVKASDVMRQYFASDMAVTVKPGDRSPVTEADVAINQMVIDSVRQAYPTHQVIGEEASFELSDPSEYSWVCDPIDGTIPFTCGYPTFTFSLALVRNGVPVLGVIADPMGNNTYVGELDGGATLNGMPIRVKQDIEFDNGVVFVESGHSLRGNDLRRQLEEAKIFTSRLHACVFGGARVIAGGAGAVVYSFPYPWDVAALAVIGAEAGAIISDLDGNPTQRYDQKVNGMVLAANQTIADQLLSMLSNTSHLPISS